MSAHLSSSQLWTWVPLALGLGVHAELLMRLRGAEPAQPWWFGYARDGANLAVAMMLWGAYGVYGFPPAVALLAAMLSTLATYLLDWLLARGLRLGRPRPILFTVLAGWVLFVALRPNTVEGLFASLVSHGRP